MKAFSAGRLLLTMSLTTLAVSVAMLAKLPSWMAMSIMPLR